MGLKELFQNTAVVLKQDHFQGEFAVPKIIQTPVCAVRKVIGSTPVGKTRNSLSM